MMGVSDPLFHIYAGVLFVLLGFIVIELRRLRKSADRK
jgi:hypothetical protein